MKPIPLFFCLLFSIAGWTQHPSFYTIGSEELQGVDIYDIHQSKDGTYWIASTNGVIRYDGYSFDFLTDPNMLSTSVFNLLEDSKGRIYCNNLSGQLFVVENGEISLKYTIPDQYLGPDIETGVTINDEIFILCRGLITLGDSITKSLIDPNGNLYNGFGKIAKCGKEHYFSSRSSANLWVFRNGQANQTSYTKFHRQEHTSYHLVGFKNRILGYGDNQHSFDLWDVTSTSSDPVVRTDQLSHTKQIYRFYETASCLWVATNTSGAYMVDEQMIVRNQDNKYFPDHFISTVSEDAEGNLLFGTFGQGLLVVPSLHVCDINLEDQPTSIESNSKDEVFIGAANGKIYTLKDGQAPHLFRNNQVKNVEALFCLNDEKLLIGEFEGILIDLTSGREQPVPTSSLKDVFQLDSSSYLLATNVCGGTLNLDTEVYTALSTLMVRHYCIGANRETGEIYSGTAKGLSYLKPSGEQSYITFNGKPIVARDILYHQGVVLVATQEHGILYFKGNRLIKQLSTSQGLVSDQVSRLGVFKDKLFAATSRGLSIINTNFVEVLNKSDGLSSTNIMDFTIAKNKLWLLHNRGVQTIELDRLSPFGFVPKLSISGVFANDTIAIQQYQGISSDKNKISFKLKAQSLRYRDEIQYQYRLQGAEDDWQTTPFNQPLIEFQALSPGIYTFQARATCRGVHSNLVSLKFEITAPFYQRWWFISLVFLVVLLLISWFFLRRLKRQKLEALRRNELNSSKLTAIQSQMNPHFIFNALNSIQDLVLKQDVENSYNYITKFANLVRSTLNYSEKDFIDFDSELQLIELYLSLEKLRFKEELEYSIERSQIDGICVPPMLIQPFIENALIHGLLHKEGLKKINIEFELREQLICTITDNGVGRKKSMEINARRRKDHDSFSVNAIKRRFEILQDNFGGDLGFDYEDLYEADHAIGTRVTLRIPTMRTF